MLLTMDKFEFGKWLQRERDKRDWSQADLARLAGIHRQSLNKIENDGVSPAVETFIALANALGLSPIILFRKAGLLPEAMSDQVNLNDWEYLLDQLPPEEQEEIREIALMKINRRKQQEESARAVNFKPGRKPQ